MAMASSSARRAAAAGGSVRFRHLVEGFNPAAAADGPALAVAAPGPHQLQARGGTQAPVRGRPQQPDFRKRATRPAPASPRPRRPVFHPSPQPSHPGVQLYGSLVEPRPAPTGPIPERNRIGAPTAQAEQRPAVQQTIGSVRALGGLGGGLQIDVAIGISAPDSARP